MKMKIGIVFSYNESWIGGTYYIINLIRALEKIDTNDKPDLVILTSYEDFVYLKKLTSYQFLSFESLDENPSSYLFKLINRISQKILKRKIITKRVSKNLDAVFPFNNNNYLSNFPLEKRIYWIPDFQEKYFPEYYSTEHLAKELKVNSWITSKSHKLVLSSATALRDMDRFYNGYLTKPYVVHFASFATTASAGGRKEILAKFKLPELFLYSPNQFWSHKNHISVIKAVEILKNRGREVAVAFSGKEYDPRNLDYTDGLKHYVKANKLENNIFFLGFLDRDDQLKLLEHCYAVVQPSLFEGWSTVVEEAMLFNKVILASDIEVNKEQLENNGVFFKRDDPSHLAEMMEKILDSLPPVNYYYELKQLKFAESFIKCVNDQ